METIKILPHHVGHYFEVYFLRRNPEKGNGWYNDEKAKQNGERTIKTVVSNPSQLIQIVSSYDAFCRICPRNKRGENYVQSEDTCTTYEDSDFSNELDTAKMLGIDALIDKEPIIAEALFDRLKPIYRKIFTEEPKQNSPKLTPREYFRVSQVELMLLQ